MKILKSPKHKEAEHFMNQAVNIAKNSTCQRAKCGTIIVKDGNIVGSGFNSPPNNKENHRRCSIEKDGYNKKITDKTCCVHAEQRAIIDCISKNPDNVKDSDLYFIRLSQDNSIIKAEKPYCTICSKLALDVGVKNFILWHEKGICSYNTDEYNDISFSYKE